MYIAIILLSYFLFTSANINDENSTMNKRALQKEHELPQNEKWANVFFGKSNNIDYQLKSLVDLLKIVTNELNNCTLMVLYDSSAEDISEIILERLFKGINLPYVHGKIDEKLTISKRLYESTKDKCLSYMLFVKDVIKVSNIIKKQVHRKVIIVSESSQWRLHEFLTSDVAQQIVNLLIICKSEQIRLGELDIPYILYTHKMYVDGLGSSKPHIIMSWYKNKLSQPAKKLFPKKITEGFAGHRFIISVAEQPPFIIRRGTDLNDDAKWDGIEIRLMKLLGEYLNFTMEVQEAPYVGTLGSGDAVARVLKHGKANIGLAGLYVTKERINDFEVTSEHSHDCAAFISLTSTALPRYRAIMGPFHWTVWLALTLTYLFAIFPIAFSDKLTLSHLLKKPEEIENMFWYVFGTFTNCFTFSGKNSWSKTKKTSTRMFIGWYWVFTIIVSACYTGSIIAFVTLPVYPTTVDNIPQLLSGHFQMGTLDKGGWQYWFHNVSDKNAIKLVKNIEYLPDVESGLRNISRAWLWPYSFIGSRDHLDYIMRTNFTTSKKRSILHIGSNCFMPFSVSIGFPKYSVHKILINKAVLRAVQSGLMIKMKNDVEWDIMRSSTGKFLQANSMGKVREQAPEDRALTLQDTQGMFLLLGAGFVMGGASLISEWLGGCFKFCQRGKRSRYNSINTQRRSMHIPTPNEKSSVDITFNPTETSKNDCSNHVDIEEKDTFKTPAIVHNNLETAENEETTTDENINTEDTTEHVKNDNEISSEEESSDLDYEINKIFNFDHLFGEDNSVTTESPSRHSENFGEPVNHDDDVVSAENELCNNINNSH